MNHTTFKAFTAFEIMQEMPEVFGREEKHTIVLNEIEESSTGECELKERSEDSNNAR